MTAAPERLRPAELGLALLVFSLTALWLYAPALRGPFVADDLGYVLNNVYIHRLDWASIRGIFDPTGDAALFTANYAPIHLLAHAIEWQLFGTRTLGYHVVNVLLHAATSVLLLGLLAHWGLPRLAAIAIAALFLVHPANVEAVAWIFQLKTILSLAFSLGALWIFDRRPGWATVLVALGVLTKISAAFVVPVLAVRLWNRRAAAREWAWLGGCAGVVVLCALPEFAAFQRLGAADVPDRYPDVATHLRSMFALVSRYALMAFTGWGTSTSHEPEPALSWADPWWLAGLAITGLVGWRTVVALARRDDEAIYWVWAAASFLPVSQIFPFRYPLADRYLYFILPGLLVGALLWARAMAPGLVRVMQDARAPARLGAGLALVLALAFAVQARARTGIWQSDQALTLDAAQHYPDGTIGTYLRAREAASRGDRAAALAALTRLADRGFEMFDVLLSDPAFAPLASDPEFQQVVGRIARNWIEVAGGRSRHVQQEMVTMARAWMLAGDEERARETLERALEQGGPLDGAIREELGRLRARQRARERAGGS